MKNYGRVRYRCIVGRRSLFIEGKIYESDDKGIVKSENGMTWYPAGYDNAFEWLNANVVECEFEKVEDEIMENMQYNPGEKVRIIRKWPAVKPDGCVGWNPDGGMDKYLGTVMTIQSFMYDHRYQMEEDDGQWTWDSRYMFVPVSYVVDGHIDLSQLMTGDVVEIGDSRYQIMTDTPFGVVARQNPLAHDSTVIRDCCGEHPDLLPVHSGKRVRIYCPTCFTAFCNLHTLEGMDCIYDEVYKPVKKMTVKEICEQLGYDVEIIKEG